MPAHYQHPRREGLYDIVEEYLDKGVVNILKAVGVEYKLIRSEDE